jgi:hypothetical protein
MFEIKDALLKKRDTEVILLNWGTDSISFSYQYVIKKMESTARETQNFIETCKIPPKNIYCIGQSLGAHLCGTISRKFILKRITGIDPSSSYFSSNEFLYSLNSFLF